MFPKFVSNCFKVTIAIFNSSKKIKALFVEALYRNTLYMYRRIDTDFCVDIFHHYFKNYAKALLKFRITKM